MDVTLEYDKFPVIGTFEAVVATCRSSYLLGVGCNDLLRHRLLLLLAYWGWRGSERVSSLLSWGVSLKN